ncbi:hypothetical protein ACWEF9_00255 [Streptomyces sp. NPDC004980]
MTTDTTTVNGPAARADLLALTPDTLTALANRGLVKRATKEVDAGAVPTVTTDPDRTVRGSFDDGTTASLPPGAGLDSGACSCAAPGVCRHLITLVLAYQRTAAAPEDGTGPAPDPRPDADPGTGTGTAPGPWSPAALDDDALAQAFGAPVLAAARRTFERGYGARVHHPTPDRPEPWVELPTCTVRFPVPGEIAYALTDAVAALRGEVVTLAVWAFRAAASASADGGALDTVQVGGRPTARPAGGGPSLDDAAGLADELLLSGVAHAGPVLGGALVRVGEALAADSLHWPAGAVAELVDQLSSYTARGADYRPELVAALLTEIHARRAAAALPSVLGVRESGETRLRRVRLTSLGCRVRATGEGAAAEVYFAHPGAAAVLVLHKRWAAADGQELTGHRLSTRRHLGTTLGSLATGNMVSESARRTASRALAISGSRVGATSVTPVATSWTELPESLLARDLAALVAAWEGRPPRLIRPRVEAESMRVVSLSEVEHVGYDPAEQRLEAVVRDEAGNRALVGSGYRSVCPGALDALGGALEEGATHISGSVHLTGGEIRIDPVAVLTPAGVIVPDLAPGDGSAALATVVGRPADPLTAALDEAVGALAAVAHSGLRHLSVPARDRIDDAATALSRTGLTRAAALLRAFLGTLDGDGAAGAAAWLAAQLHLLVSSELLAAGGA